MDELLQKIREFMAECADRSMEINRAALIFLDARDLANDVARGENIEVATEELEVLRRRLGPRQ